MIGEEKSKTGEEEVPIFYSLRSMINKEKMGGVVRRTGKE